MDLDSAILQVSPQPAAYVLLGSDAAYLYKGACRDLVERLKDHRAGRVSRTKHRRPLRLVFHQHFDSYSEALRKEDFLKSGQGRAWLKRHLAPGTDSHRATPTLAAPASHVSDCRQLRFLMF